MNRNCQETHNDFDPRSFNAFEYSTQYAAACTHKLLREYSVEIVKPCHQLCADWTFVKLKEEEKQHNTQPNQTHNDFTQFNVGTAIY